MKSMGNVMETITSSVGKRDQELQESERNQDSEERENIIESEEIINIRISTLSEVYQNIDSNLNINSSGVAIIAKVTDLLFTDDLKVFAQSQSKLNKVLMSTQEALKDIGLDLNPKKC